jgi:predicted kinase
LLDLATLCIHAELAVIVDATFLKSNHRKMFMELAEKLKVPFRILHFCAPDELLMERVQNRSLRGNDASDANTEVLAKQLEHLDALTTEESAVTLAINTEQRVDAAAVASLLQSATAL